MARTILWAGRYGRHIESIAHAAHEKFAEEIHSYTLSLPEQNYKDGSIFNGISNFLSNNRLTVEPFDLLIVGISWREFEYIAENNDYYFQRILAFRNNFDKLRFLNGRSAATVPILLTSECFSTQQTPNTLESNLYIMGTSDAFGRVATGLLVVSHERFIQSLDILGFSLVPEGDNVVPYIIARDSSFEGHSDFAITSAMPTNQLVSKQVGGWFLLNGRYISSLRDAIDEFTFLINNTSVREKELHQFFLKHPEFLYRNEFRKLWYEPRLKIPDEISTDFLDKAVEPDFILGGDKSDDPLCLVEIKLPGVNLLVNDAQQLSAKVISGLAQLRKYKRYFADGSSALIRRNILGTDYSFPKCLLLIGRLPSAPQARRTFEKIRHDELPGVHLLTYDEVLNFQKGKLTELLRQTPP